MTELAAAVLALALGWSAGGSAGLGLTAMALALAWLISRLLWPCKPCPRCHGSGRNPGSNTRRHGNCKRCKGARRIRRADAGYVHRVKLALLNHDKEK